MDKYIYPALFEKGEVKGYTVSTFRVISDIDRGENGFDSGRDAEQISNQKCNIAPVVGERSCA